MKRIILLALTVLFCFTPLSHDAQSKRKKKKKDKEKTEEVQKPPVKKANGKVKPYYKVITANAQSDDGLFTVHKVGEKYYFEIPNQLLDKDMLLVSRIAKLPSNLGGGFYNAGTADKYFSRKQ